MFNNRQEFIESASSEKITLAVVYPAQQVSDWVEASPDIWKITVPFFVNRVKNLTSELVKVSNILDLANGKYFYNSNTNELSIFSETDPNLLDYVVFYKLFLSDAPIKLSEDFNFGIQVDFDPRIRENPGFKSILSADGNSLVGGGTLSLINTDGFYDNLYNSLVWEGKLVEIYSHNRDLADDEVKLIYRGYVEDKLFTNEVFNLNVKDNIFKLDQEVTLKKFKNTSYTVFEKSKEAFLRRVYGKTNGLQCVSLDPCSEAYDGEGWLYSYRDDGKEYWISSIQNPVYPDTSSKIFPDTFEAGDIFIINNGYQTIKYNIEEMADNNTFTLSLIEDADTLVAGNTIPNFYGFVSGLRYKVLKKNRISNYRNRRWLVAGHRLSSFETTITAMTELNRFTVSNSSLLFVGDRILIDGYYYFIKTVVGNVITTTFSSFTGLNIGSTVTKIAVLDAYINGKKIAYGDITSIEEGSDYHIIEISQNAEKNIADTRKNALSVGGFRSKVLVDSSLPAARTNIVYFPHKVDYATEELFSRIPIGSYIKITSDGDESYVRVVNTFKGSDTKYNELWLEKPYDIGLTNATFTWDVKVPTLLKDGDNLVVDCYGKPVDNLVNTRMISTASEIIYDLLNDIDLLTDYLNQDSFDEASELCDNPMSIVLPEVINATAAPKIKDIVNKINKSVRGALFVSQDLTLGFKILQAYKDLEPFYIRDADVISWSMKGKGQDLYRKIEAGWDFRDYDVDKKEKSNYVFNKEDNFVKNLEISNKTLQVSIYTSEETSAMELAERILFHKSLTETVVSLVGAYNLTQLEVGQQVILELNGLFKNSFNLNQFIGIVSSLKIDGDSVQVDITDLGNIFNRGAVITEDTALDYSSASEEERMLSGYIVEDNGLVTGSLETKGKNLIS